MSENRSMERVRARRATNGPARIHTSRPVPARQASVAWRVGVSPDAPANGRTGRGETDDAIAQIAERVRMRRRTRYERYVKPVVDRLVGVLMLLVAVPALLVIALAVWLTLGSPILIRQERIGRGGRPFHMLKFRTMRPDRRHGPDSTYTGPDRRVTHKSPNDPRHTPLGRKLRQNSLDELPQLINVVRGDMSLVGPRPELCSVAASYEDWQHLRHLVRPGLTGLWQVTERANGTVMHEHTELDLHYVDKLSASTDLGILLRTPLALLKKEQVH